MRRRVGNPRRPPRRHLRSQHRHDLRPEQLDLLEHHLQRQTDRVDVPELALVVAEAFLEGERLLDHLLRTADAHRRRPHVVVERVRRAVQRRPLEVRAERLHGVLRSLGDERVPAEADDRLLRRAVPVMREALAVQVHERDEMEVGREQVVREVPVAVIGRLLGDLGCADRPVPDERRHVVERPRDRRESLQRRPEPPLPVDHVLAPQAVQQVVVLECERQPLLDVLAEPRIHRCRVPTTQHQIHPPARQVLQHRVVLGDLHRIVRRDQRHRRAQDDPLRQRSDMRQQGRR